jgi:hypothetical protein
MRIWMIGTALLLACHGTASKGGGGSSTPTPPADDAAMHLPVVDPSATRAALAGSYVRIDRDGRLTIGEVPAAARRGDAIDLAALGAGTKVAAADLRARLHPAAATPTPAPAPPPSPPEPDAGAAGRTDEAGGTGTAMLLDEGKMGRKDTEGGDHQYKMKKNLDQESLAREQAIQQAKIAGVVGTVPGNPDSVFASYTSTGAGDDGAGSVPDLGAFALDPDGGGKAAAGSPIIIADARAPAHALLDAVHAADQAATIAVVSRAGDPARALAIAFGITPKRAADAPMVDTDFPDTELVLEIGGATAELRVEHDGEREASPLAWKGTADTAAIAGAYGNARADATWAGRDDLHVIVDDSATVGTLVAALAGAYGRGVVRIHLGPDRNGAASAPPPSAPQLHLGQITSVGELDQALIHKYVKRNLNKIQYCYDKPRLADPTLAGTVTAQFVIGPHGDVTASSATGVDAAVSSCIADVLQHIQFPEPKGGGSVQVSYPFTFEPSGG